ncbi:MAG: FAD-dependent oxidoreductase, partial [Actinobacteria bacterium]
MEPSVRNRSLGSKRRVRDGQELDVLVIGAGAAGAALAARLAEHGAQVLCLEQGDWVDASTLPKTSADWEVRGRHTWNPSPGKRRAPEDY